MCEYFRDRSQFQYKSHHSKIIFLSQVQYIIDINERLFLSNFCLQRGIKDDDGLCCGNDGKRFHQLNIFSYLHLFSLLLVSFCFNLPVNRNSIRDKYLPCKRSEVAQTRCEDDSVLLPVYWWIYLRAMQPLS